MKKYKIILMIAVINAIFATVKIVCFINSYNSVQTLFQETTVFNFSGGTVLDTLLQ